MISLEELLRDICDGIVRLDTSGENFRSFQPGAGPYGEPQLIRAIAAHLSTVSRYKNRPKVMRTPDLLVPGEWALEFKIARPFGDNGKEAENWSVNLLHPYCGNASALGDCLKLLKYAGKERRAVVTVWYEHSSPIVEYKPLIRSFEVIADQVLGLNLSNCVSLEYRSLIHPVHQTLRLFAWEVLPGGPSFA